MGIYFFIITFLPLFFPSLPLRILCWTWFDVFIINSSDFTVSATLVQQSIHGPQPMVTGYLTYLCVVF
ncbi:hypothetical protein K435DRAFT_771699 [Dendrothele bispora CBS 962.96]|uniref:Uncharacterized protein n=1 Tax=Dendrothele bispora (strain CBS 962.96) TaxID=1314807 RepID=A0A4V6T5S2_DENBC|nr:hypothetical protein K435DRAFT_771699 [Dendrothele bispora CBS 962.96]